MAGDQKKFQAAMAYAEKMSAQKKWAEAGKAYRYALAEFPNNEAAIMGFGRASLRAGQKDFAMRAFQQVLRVNPMNHEALAHIAETQEQSGQTAAAAETYLRLGNVYAGKMELDSAIGFWNRAVELGPEKVEAHRRLAQALQQQGQPRQAARRLLELAAIYQQQSDTDSAMKLIQETAGLLPDDPGVEAAKTALQTGKPIQPEAISETPPAPAPSDEVDFFGDFAGQAEDSFEEDIFGIPEELPPDEGSKQGLVGAAQEKALADLANIVFEDNSTPQSTMLIIQAIDLQANGKFSEAAHNYHQVVQSGLKHSALYFNLGLLWKELGQFNQALEMLNIAVQDKQYHLSAQFALGEIYHANGKVDSALKCFVEVVKTVDLRIAPGPVAQEIAPRYEGLVNDFLGQGDVNKINLFIETLEEFFAHPAWEKKALEARQLMDGIGENGAMSLAEYLESPETEVVISTMALTDQYMKRNLLLTASEECLRAIQNAPAYLPLHIRLADILLKQGRINEAVSKYLYIAKIHQMRETPELSIDVYHKILDIAPMNIRVRGELIRLYRAQGEVERALEQYLTLADSHYQLAQVDKALDRYKEALRLSNKVTNGQSWKINILRQMGDIYNQRFDWAGAARVYEGLLKLKPNDEHIQRRLIDFYYRQNRIKEAIKMLDNLLDIYQRQAPLKSVEMLKELSANHPQDMLLLQRLAIAYAQNGMTQEAIANYDKLGELQLESGMRNEAIQTIQAILNLGPEDTEGYRRLLAQLGGGSFG